MIKHTHDQKLFKINNEKRRFLINKLEAHGFNKKEIEILKTKYWPLESILLGKAFWELAAHLNVDTQTKMQNGTEVYRNINDFLCNRDIKSANIIPIRISKLLINMDMIPFENLSEIPLQTYNNFIIQIIQNFITESSKKTRYNFKIPQFYQKKLNKKYLLDNL